MRDAVLFLIVFAALPLMLRRPAVGIMFWVAFSMMNPHRLAWGAAYAFPFSMVIAIATLIGVVFTREPRQFKGGAAAWVLLAFVAWVCLTTMFALEPDRAATMLERVLKILFVTFLALFTLYKREHVKWLVLTIVASIGFYGLKGGLFTIATGGGYRVWGPPESFIADNNALALAVSMTIPLFAYLYIMSTKRWVRAAIILAIALCAACVLGSYSRGGLLAIVAMSAFLWIKAKGKLWLGLAVVLLGIGFYSFMPTEWLERMTTITAYERDASAVGRLSVWTMLFNLALDRPIVGGGFEPYTADVFRRYLPDYAFTHSAHSIYFQVLGEHGFVGFALFIAFWMLTWQLSRRIIKHTKNDPSMKWAYWLAAMVQVSLIGYFVGGIFLNLAYWDMPYFLMIALAVTWHVVRSTRSDLVTPSALRPDLERVPYPVRSPPMASP